MTTDKVKNWPKLVDYYMRRYRARDISHIHKTVLEACFYRKVTSRFLIPTHFVTYTVQGKPLVRLFSKMGYVDTPLLCPTTNFVAYSIDRSNEARSSVPENEIPKGMLDVSKGRVIRVFRSEDKACAAILRRTKLGYEYPEGRNE